MADTTDLLARAPFNLAPDDIAWVRRTLASLSTADRIGQLMLYATFGDDPGVVRSIMATKPGGIHRFMNWDRPILTDSGGFQVFSLGALRRISEEGVRFQSPVNGDACFLSPEESMRIQRVLNSDIVMVFDECSSPGESKLAIENTVARTTSWARRSKKALERLQSEHPEKNLFPHLQEEKPLQTLCHQRWR